MARFMLLLVIGGLLLAGNSTSQTSRAEPATAVETGDSEAAETLDTLEGTLRVHPKFHYRYYIDGFGDGQHCALFEADEDLRKIEPGNRIRVQGELKSKFFGNPDDPTPALVQTWIIYMDVDAVEVLQGATARPSE